MPQFVFFVILLLKGVFVKSESAVMCNNIVKEVMQDVTYGHKDATICIRGIILYKRATYQTVKCCNL